MTPERLAEITAHAEAEHWRPNETLKEALRDLLALVAEKDAEIERAESESQNAQADYDRRGERLWRLAAQAGHVSCESDNDATAELVIADALADLAAARAALGRVEALISTGRSGWTEVPRREIRAALGDGGEA